MLIGFFLVMALIRVRTNKDMKKPRHTRLKPKWRDDKDRPSIRR